MTLQNQEASTFWYAVDPPGLEGLTVGSRQLTARVQEYFELESADFPFQPLEPDSPVTLTGLAPGAHLLVGFFLVEGEEELPVRAFSVQVDTEAGDRFYALFSGPALLTIPRAAGRLVNLESVQPGGEGVAIEQMECDEMATEEAPIEEMTIEEAPIEEMAAEEAPIEEMAIEEAPIEELAAEEAPIEEMAAEEAPIEEMAAEEAPIEELAAEEAPIEEMAAEEAPIEEMAAEEAPIEEMAAEEAPIEETAVEEASTEEPPADELALEETPAEEPTIEETPVEEMLPEELAIEQAPAELPAEVASFSATYSPVVFTRESRAGFAVLPLAQSRYWGEPGTRLDSLEGLLRDGVLELTLKTQDGFSPDVSYFFYLFGERALGRENAVTIELLPLARDGRGACVLWQKAGESSKARAVPRFVGQVTTFGRSCSLALALADLPAEALAAVGDNPSMDLSSCRYDGSKAVFEEFYFTTLHLADFPGRRGRAGHTLNRMSRTSPSFTMYSLPSSRTLLAFFAPW